MLFAAVAGCVFATCSSPAAGAHISGQPAFRPRPHWSTTKTSPTRAFLWWGIRTSGRHQLRRRGRPRNRVARPGALACHRRCHVRPTVLGKPRLYLVPIGEPGARGRLPAVLQCVRRGRRCHVSRSLDIKITVRTLREREPSALLVPGERWRLDRSFRVPLRRN